MSDQLKSASIREAIVNLARQIPEGVKITFKRNHGDETTAVEQAVIGEDHGSFTFSWIAPTPHDQSRGWQ
jgi:hypothetical protein